MNILAIISAGVAAWIIGSLWYGKIFGKTWQTELGFSDEDLEGANMVVIFGGSLVLMCMMMYGLSFIIGAHAEIDFVHGAFHGMMAGILFASASMGINYLYQRRSLKLFLIDAGYQILFMAVGGGIMAAWPW